MFTILGAVFPHACSDIGAMCRPFGAKEPSFEPVSKRNRLPACCSAGRPGLSVTNIATEGATVRTCRVFFRYALVSSTYAALYSERLLQLRRRRSHVRSLRLWSLSIAGENETWSVRCSGTLDRRGERWISVLSFQPDQRPTVPERRTPDHWQWRAFVRHQTPVIQVSPCRPSRRPRSGRAATGGLPGSTGLSRGISVRATTAIEFSISIDRLLVAPNGILIASIYQAGVRNSYQLSSKRRSDSRRLNGFFSY